MKETKIVTDRNGVQYELTALLGRGGQGAVYAVKGGRLAVKLVEGKGVADLEMMRNQLMHVRRLPLSDLALAKPLEMLRPPATGYLMEMLSDMGPIKSLMVPPKGQPPSAGWYASGGGLRRRLLLLGRAAHILSLLHGKGLAYADPSPANIFISADCDAHEVRFIDTDNLRYHSDPLDGRRGVFTPGYGAPELVQGKSGVTSLTDVHALAVIAFQVLTLVHPFVGDLVNDGEPELEEQAFSGLLPWIEDPADDRNRASFGISRSLVLSPRLLDLFNRTFGEGRSNPAVRPGAAEWAERLYGAADLTVTCPSCCNTFYSKTLRCPWCDAAPSSYAVGVFALWNPALGESGGLSTVPGVAKNKVLFVNQLAITDGSTVRITRRLAFGQTDDRADEPVMEISVRGSRAQVRSLDGKAYRMTAPGAKQTSEVGDIPRTLSLDEKWSSWVIHFGAKDSLHRVVSFILRKG